MSDAVIVASILLVFATPCTASQVQESFPHELDLWLDGGLTAGGVALISGAVAVRRGQEPLTVGEIEQLDPADINGFDRSATAQWSTTARDVSNALVVPLVAAPLVLAIATSGSRQSWTVAAMYGEVLLVASGLGELLNDVTNRTRPFAYNDDQDIPDEARFEVRRSPLIPVRPYHDRLRRRRVPQLSPCEAPSWLVSGDVDVGGLPDPRGDHWLHALPGG